MTFQYFQYNFAYFAPIYAHFRAQTFSTLVYIASKISTGTEESVRLEALQHVLPINAIGRAEAGWPSLEDNSVVVDVASLHGKMGQCDGWGSHNVHCMRRIESCSCNSYYTTPHPYLKHMRSVSQESSLWGKYNCKFTFSFNIVHTLLRCFMHACF